jgi:hypothetical protein
MITKIKFDANLIKKTERQNFEREKGRNGEGENIKHEISTNSVKK